MLKYSSSLRFSLGQQLHDPDPVGIPQGLADHCRVHCIHVFTSLQQPGLEQIESISYGNDPRRTDGHKRPQQFGFTALPSMIMEGRLRVVTAAIIKLSTVPAGLLFPSNASATGMVPKMSAYMGTPAVWASTTPKEFRLPSTSVTRCSGIHSWITAPMPTPRRI